LADPVRPYVQIKPDGTVLVLSSQLEMGQGAHTGLATIVAEELDADFDSIQVVNAANGTTPNGDVYGNLVGGGFQITGASTSTRAFWARYRQVAAQARARLVAAASETWVCPTEVEIDLASSRTPAESARRSLISPQSPRRCPFRMASSQKTAAHTELSAVRTTTCGYRRQDSG
jgi:CO/xanthine dehydrogenase Mo-binding subunit